jgi:phage tail sheath protein FI
MALTDTGAGSLVTFLQSRLATPPATSLQAQSRILLERLMTDANDTVPNGGLGAGTVTVPAAGYTVPLAGPKAYFLGAGNVAPKVIAAISDYNAIWNALKSQLDLIVSTTTGYLDTVEKSVVEVIPALKTIFRAISNEYLTLPPSSSIAGIYASVDASRGVWKAPANVSLNSVVGVTELIDNREQGSLNVDVIAGKSINIIRPFTGKGILVWGARTLAGNDNEWRYVSVRRFFIMVEESARKATEMFVFEGNDANTWVRVRAMIENFLTLQWRAGALAGAKPEHAFFVRVGLGQTMTANDILEGRMIVEIGMAVVRPAEFIILRFSHKMQES